MPFFLSKVTEIPGRPLYVYATATDLRQAFWSIRRAFNDFRFEATDHGNPWVKMERPVPIYSFYEVRDKKAVQLGYEVVYSKVLQERLAEDAQHRVKEAMKTIRI